MRACPYEWRAWGQLSSTAGPRRFDPVTAQCRPEGHGLPAPAGAEIDYRVQGCPEFIQPQQRFERRRVPRLAHRHDCGAKDFEPAASKLSCHRDCQNLIFTLDLIVLYLVIGSEKRESCRLDVIRPPIPVIATAASARNGKTVEPGAFRVILL